MADVVASLIDLMLVIQWVGARRALRHFFIVDAPSQRSASCEDVAKVSRHSAAGHHMTLGTAAVTLGCIVANRLMQMPRDATAGYHLGGGGHSGFTSRINAMS